MSIGDKLKKRLEQLEKAKQAETPEEKMYKQLAAQDAQKPAEQTKTDSAEQSYEKPEQPAVQRKISVGEQLAKRGVQSQKTLEEEVAELIKQANIKTSDSDDITQLKENIPIYATAMPAITYDHIIIILDGELNVYKDVHEGDINKFENLVLLEREWKSTYSQQKREEFFFKLMKLQEEYKPEYAGELALAYLRNLANGEKK